MPNDKPSYSEAHKKRKDDNASRIVVEGVDEPKQDPMTGVTDPRRLLRSDTQRIDRNIIDPFSPDYPKRAGAPEELKKT